MHDDFTRADGAGDQPAGSAGLRPVRPLLPKLGLSLSKIVGSTASTERLGRRASRQG
jgi:hypothetical protein